MKLVLDFTVLKSYAGISYEPAQNMFKINSKLAVTLHLAGPFL